MSFGKTSGKSKRIKFGRRFKQTADLADEILRESFGATLDQRQFQGALFALLEPEFNRLVEEGQFEEDLGSAEERAKFLRDTIDRNTRINDQAAALSEQLGEAARNLGTLTDTDRELISSAIGNARAIGQQQIDDFVAGNFRASNEVAAARGLRPSDSPIGNVRGRVAEEAIRQKGALESQLGARAAGLALDIPLQRTALLGNLAGQQSSLAQGANEFQAALAQNATANRLNLAGTAGQLGLGLASTTNITPGVLAAERPATGSKSSGFNFGFGSSKTFKTNFQALDAAEVLGRLQALPIEAWEYLWEQGEDAFRVGPYAEDFQAAFGGEKYRINLLHALGVSMVALQEVTRRIERIEERMERAA